MLLKTEAVVIRTIKYKDTSVIADLLTRERGMLTVIAGGVRKSRSRMPASIFQPPSLIEAVMYYKDNSNMHRLKEARQSFPLIQIFEQLKRIAIAQFVAELVKKTVSNREPHRELFEFVRSTVVELETAETVNPNMPLMFMLELAVHLGISPEFKKTGGKYLDLREGVVYPTPPQHPHFLSEELTLALKKLLMTRDQKTEMPRINNETRRQLFTHLTQYYLIHVDGMKPMKSPEIFRTIFEK